MRIGIVLYGCGVRGLLMEKAESGEQAEDGGIMVKQRVNGGNNSGINSIVNSEINSGVTETTAESTEEANRGATAETTVELTVETVKLTAETTWSQQQNPTVKSTENVRFVLGRYGPLA